MTTLIQNAIPDNYLSIDELTEASLDGDGVLDTLLRTMRLHLDQEFKNNRITGTAYATVYAQSLTAFLQQAIQYTLSKSKLALELEGLRAQNQLLITENDKVLAEINRIATDTAVAIKQGHLIDAQTCEVKARTNQVNAETAVRLPVEVENMMKQGQLTTAQTEQTIFTTEYVLPKELDQKNAQIANTQKQTSLLAYELTQIKPQEMALKARQADLAEYELLQIKPKELELLMKQIAVQEHMIQYKLPAEVTHISAQTDLYKQKEKTEKAQIDPSGVLPNSVIDLQNKMMKAQADGFLRDAEQKATKLLVDTWSIRKNSDPDGNPENNTNKLADANIGLAVQKMLQGIGVSV